MNGFLLYEQIMLTGYFNDINKQNVDTTVSRIKSATLDTYNCGRHGTVFVAAAGCAVGALFGTFILPFSIGLSVGVIIHHEFENNGEKHGCIQKKE